MSPRYAYFRTYSGIAVNLLDPRPGDINLLDIAWALSRICRYAGHIQDHYSVAQHSVLVSEVCRPEHALLGLLHDASEAYVGDIITPLKEQLPDYHVIERAWQHAIGSAWGLDGDLVNLPPDVHLADKRLLATELRDLFQPPRNEWCQAAPLGWPVSALPQQNAFRAYVRRFCELTSTNPEHHGIAL